MMLPVPFAVSREARTFLWVESAALEMPPRAFAAMILSSAARLAAENPKTAAIPSPNAKLPPQGDSWFTCELDSAWIASLQRVATRQGFDLDRLLTRIIEAAALMVRIEREAAESVQVAVKRERPGFVPRRWRTVPGAGAEEWTPPEDRTAALMGDPGYGASVLAVAAGRQTGNGE